MQVQMLSNALNCVKVNTWKKEIHSICEQVLWILFYDAISSEL